MRGNVSDRRVLSGMRPTGRLHLGHYHGVLKHWIRLQHEYECWFFVADWHALTSLYEQPRAVVSHVFDVLVDWLAVGVNPGSANLFIQSQVPEHAELQLILGMITPLSWLERVPSYKDYRKKLSANATDKEQSTLGFLGYPLLQSADILLYRAGLVPVGGDQVAHVEFTRNVAKRFNYLYGRDAGFAELAEAAVKKLGTKAAQLYRKLSLAYQEQGDHEALTRGRALLNEHPSLSLGDQERLFGYLEGGGRMVLPEPQALLTETPKVPGTDGAKMSKSLNNSITLRDTDDEIASKIRTMQTDPARLRRSNPGNPEECPVWDLHKIYSDDQTKDWVQNGCTGASIGCVDCKKPVIEAIQADISPIRSAAKRFEQNREFILQMIAEGAEKARTEARNTLEEVRDAMEFSHR